MEIKKIVISLLVVSAAMVAMVSMGFATATSSDINISLLKYTPYPAEPGKYITLTLKIDNSGNSDANDVKLKLLSEYPFYLDNGSTINVQNSASKVLIGSDSIASVGKIPASQYTIVEYSVRVDNDVLEGKRQLSIWHQVGTGDIWAEDDFDIDVQGTDRLEVSNVSPAILLPGKATDTIFVLNNTGTASIRDVKFVWAEKNGEILPLGSGNIKYANAIPAGTAVEIPFTLVANPSATSGIYNIIANISYTIGSNITKTQQVSIGMFIGGKGEFDVNIQEYSSGSATIAIANIGETTASSVSVSIPEQPSYSVAGASSSFIGNMDPGDYMTATFSITQNSMSFGGIGNTTHPGSINSTYGKLLVDITYTDTNGNRETIEKQVVLSTGNATAFGGFSASGNTTNFQSRNRGFSMFPGMGVSQSSGSMLIVYGVAGFFLIITAYVFRKKITALIKREKVQERKRQ